jgi:hypothetical protein
MEPKILPNERMDTLSDAMHFALSMTEAVKAVGFAPPASALWLGANRDEPDYTCMFVALPIPDPTTFVTFAEGFVGCAEMIFWRYTDDAQSDAEAAAFFAHRDELEAKGIMLLDEIIVSRDGEILTSLAVRTFADREGWDDVSEPYNALEGE